MVNFGDYIVERQADGWDGKYVAYDLLKRMLDQMVSMPVRQRPQAEYNFSKEIDKQLVIVNTFFKEKVNGLITSLDPAHRKPVNPTKEGWVLAAERKTKELAVLEEYAYLNYEGFRKILKKHDKLCEVKLMPAFMIDLDHNEQSFWRHSRKLRSCVDAISEMYERGGRYENLDVEPIEAPQAEGDNDDQVEGGVKKSFIRKNHKFWVPRHRFLELLSRLSAYLPLFYFNEQGVDALTTSVYLDNDKMGMFARRLRREDGATLIRFRLYGENKPSGSGGSAFVERKTHCEAIYGGSSKKERFQIHETDTDAAMAGQLVEIRNEGATDAQLAAEVSEEVQAKNLRAFTTTRYRRTVFQKPTDDRLRLSVDSQLSMTREFDINDWQLAEHLGRVPTENEFYEFPYIVMELKLRDVHMPDWFEKLIKENLCREVPKFSKFIHSVVAFKGNDVPELPYWVEEQPELFNIGILGRLSPKSSQVGVTSVSRKDEKSVIDTSEDTSSPNSTNIVRRMAGYCLPEDVLSYGRLLDGGSGRGGKQRSGGGRPQKMDPKAFMANERTFLNWNQQAITLSTFGVALMALVDEEDTAAFAGLLMVLTGISVLCFAQYQYHRRYTLLQNRASGLEFLDRRGPMVLTFLLVLTFTMSVVYRMPPPAPGMQPLSPPGAMKNPHRGHSDKL